MVEVEVCDSAEAVGTSVCLDECLNDCTHAPRTIRGYKDPKKKNLSVGGYCSSWEYFA